jgi:uncharacterized protein (TIGR00299 family) protein
MFLGALLDLGLPTRALLEDLDGLDVPFRLVVRRVRRGALAARWVDVLVPTPGAGRSSAGAARRARTGGARRPRPGAARERRRLHDHAHEHGHGSGAEAHPHRDRGPGRRWTEIRRRIERARLVAPVRERALAIFSALAAAEARVHGIAVEEVHFHEVGAVDALVDVVGAAVGLHRLGIGRVTCTPLPLGHGSVDTDHGRMPLPAPATLELLRGLPVVPAHLAWETVTPTGAAIVRTVVDAFCELPAMRIEAVGHGAGNDRAGGLPNVLRVLLGRTDGFGADRVVQLEAHLDDLNPEHFEYLMERLFEAGALDVALQHLQMKKNRPGFSVRVVARPAERDVLARVLFAESTTLGVRVTEADRVVLPRVVTRVGTPFGPVRVKWVADGDGRPCPSAEYEDCKRVARRVGVPLREVVRVAEEAARAAGPGRGRSVPPPGQP